MRVPHPLGYVFDRVRHGTSAQYRFMADEHRTAAGPVLARVVETYAVRNLVRGSYAEVGRCFEVWPADLPWPQPGTRRRAIRLLAALRCRLPAVAAVSTQARLGLSVRPTLSTSIRSAELRDLGPVEDRVLWTDRARPRA
jgi:hypothetical protein